jgi:hypothetical protein
MILPSSLATSRRSIRGIVIDSSKIKMGRIAARRIVAMMADEHAVRDWAVVNHVRHTIGTILPALKYQPAIAIFVATTLPFPTCVRCSGGYTCPKSVLE